MIELERNGEDTWNGLTSCEKPDFLIPTSLQSIVGDLSYL